MIEHGTDSIGHHVANAYEPLANNFVRIYFREGLLTIEPDETSDCPGLTLHKATLRHLNDALATFDREGWFVTIPESTQEVLSEFIASDWDVFEVSRDDEGSVTLAAVES